MSAPYQIARWEQFYEVADSRKVDGPLNWVAVRTKTDGFGFRRIASAPNRCELLAAWYLMLGIAAKQSRADRGKLQRDGQPLTAEDMEIMTGFPAQIFADALVFFSDKKQGWLLPPGESESIRKNPDGSGQVPPTGQDNTGQDSSLPKGRPSDWIAELKRAHPEIDIDAQIRRASAYQRKRGAKLERDWFVSTWLKRASPEVPVADSDSTKIDEPAGWREYMQSEYPGCVFVDEASPRYAATWVQLPADYQKLVADKLNKRSAA